MALVSPALDILKDLVSGSVGPLTLSKAALDVWNNYTQTRELEALTDFVRFIADKTGDLQQLLSEPYLKTPDGQRFAHKIFAAAVDARQAEKRELFANALINGTRKSELEELDRLRFVDLLSSLSAASLVKLAEIHKRCESALVEKMGHPDWECVGLHPEGGPPKSIPANSDVHYSAAALRELKSSGVLGKARYAPDEKAPGTLKAVTISTEANYYNAYTRAFARFISSP